MVFGCGSLMDRMCHKLMHAGACAPLLGANRCARARVSPCEPLARDLHDDLRDREAYQARRARGTKGSLLLLLGSAPGSPGVFPLAEPQVTPAQVDLLQRSWRAVLPVGDTAAELFYGKLFSLDPRLKVLFKNDMREQGRNLTAMISVAVGALERPERIERAVRELGRRHTAYGVRSEHYGTVGVALLWMLEKCLGEAFTPEVKRAWSDAYALLAGIMQDSAAPVSSG